MRLTYQGLAENKIEMATRAVSVLQLFVNFREGKARVTCEGHAPFDFVLSKDMKTIEAATKQAVEEALRTESQELSAALRAARAAVDAEGARGPSLAERMRRWWRG